MDQAINWYHACAVDARTVLHIEPWFENGSRAGCTIYWSASDGKKYGCRQVSERSPSDFAVCVSAWINDARDNGKPVKIDARSRQLIDEHFIKIAEAVLHAEVAA